MTKKLQTAGPGQNNSAFADRSSLCRFLKNGKTRGRPSGVFDVLRTGPEDAYSRSVEPGMRRYWFEFDVPPIEPPSGPGIALDGPDHWSPIGWVRMGVGVTGVDEEDCLSLVRQRIFDGGLLPPIRRIAVDVDVSTLGDQVLPNMEIPIWRGIWFPRGFVDGTHSRKR